MPDKIQTWHRRHAIQVAAALPETIEDALIVLALAQQLVTGFLADSSIMGQRIDTAPDRDSAVVVSLSSATSGSKR